MELREQFETAAAESKNLSAKPDSDTLLQLYSLYKQSTDGDINSEPPTNPFDFVSKAKYEAWASIKGKEKETAMVEYVALVNKLKA